MTDISEAEKNRRINFARLVGKGYYPRRPEHTTMYAPSGGGSLSYVLLPRDARLPLQSTAEFVNLPTRTKLQDGSSC
jgi:hypothetical protein